MYLVTAERMQQMDRRTIEEFGIPGRVLMETAGRAATRTLLNFFGDPGEKKVGIVAGKGNNGGDGFVMARCLALMGIKVTVYLLGRASSLTGDAEANLRLLKEMNIPVLEVCDQKSLLENKSSMARCGILVDAIFGTGLNSEVRGFFRAVIEFINSLEKPVLAVDIPSGLHPDTGRPLGVCIKARVTATFGFAKIGQLVFPGASFCGKLVVADIGIPTHIADEICPDSFILTPEKIASYYTIPKADAHKGSSGHLLIGAGSPGKTGAAALTARSAMRCGAGLVTLGIPESLNPILEVKITEAMTLPLPETREGMIGKTAVDLFRSHLEDKKCLALGPGLGTSSKTAGFVKEIISQCSLPMVIDADALNCLEGGESLLKEAKAPIIITPHPGEMARLSGKTVSWVQNNRLKCAASFATEFHVHVVLKGARTIIAHPDGRTFVNPTGNPVLAAGGTGDVLTGMIAGFLCRSYSPEASAHMGAYLHGAAADILKTRKGHAGILAGEIMDELPGIMEMAAEKRLPGIDFISCLF